MEESKIRRTSFNRDPVNPLKNDHKRTSGLKFRQNLKELACDTDESSTDKSDNDSSPDSEDFSDKCGVCNSKYPSFSESKKCSSKIVDKWIQCDMCTEWFHLICLPRS